MTLNLCGDMCMYYGKYLLLRDCNGSPMMDEHDKQNLE